jgi:hypothetical protein
MTEEIDATRRGIAAKASRLDWGNKLGEFLALLLVGMAGGAICGLIEGGYLFADDFRGSNSGVFMFFLPIYLLCGIAKGGLIGAAMGLLPALLVTALSSAIPDRRIRRAVQAVWPVFAVSMVLLMLVKPEPVEDVLVRESIVAVAPTHGG